jgi:hypothetical protein
MVPAIQSRSTPINSYECLVVKRGGFEKKQMRKIFGIDLPNKPRVYKKLYPSYFDSVAYPIGWRIPDFMKFNGGR